MAKKRSRQSGTGTVYFSGGFWYAAVMVGGRRRRARCGSKPEAMAKRDELCKLAEANSSLKPSTFGGFRARWLDHIKANKSVKTEQAYRYAVDHFLELDPVSLERVTGQAIQQIVDKLSGRTRQQAFDKCRQMMKTAIRWKCLAVNPMENLERPSHGRGAVDPFEVTEVTSIIKHFELHRYSAAVQLAFACGLRGGELWGLQWSDFQGNELTVQRQACETAGTLEIKSPKTAAGIRRILLPDSVVTALEVRRKDAMREGLAAEKWIFPGPDGGVTRRSNFGNRVWGPALKKLKLRHRGFHHARHTAATLLLNAGGVPLSVVSKMLGHASPAITLETYAHVMLADQARHRNAFDAVLRVG